VAFEIGDKVIYPNHGLGIVERIETKTIMGTTCGFYQLRMANETTVFVPVDNVDGVGLRRAITDSEVERLFGISFREYFSQELTELTADGSPTTDGLVRVGPDAIEVTPTGRLFIRNVCMVFDRYLRARTASAKPVFSRTV
jgi:hypothetical protein